MGSLRGLHSEGTEERRAHELDQIDLPYGVPPEGLTLVIFDEHDQTHSVEFKATRSNFLEKVRKAWRDYASQRPFSGKPAILAILVVVYRDNMERFNYLWITHKDGASARKPFRIPDEVETQEKENRVWEEIVATWARCKDKLLA